MAKEREEFISANDIPVVEPTKKLKLNNLESSVKPSLKPKLEDFRKKIDQLLESEAEQKKVGFNIIHRFFELLSNKTLDEFKNPETRNYEKIAIKDLLDFAKFLNSDEKQIEENFGTMIVLQALLQAVYKQRDRINYLESRIEKYAKTQSPKK